jgi:hypothetical protein
MSRIIINSKGIDDETALIYVTQVVNQGKISNNEKQYCYVTRFNNGVYVSSDLTKNNTHSFKIWKTI